MSARIATVRGSLVSTGHRRIPPKMNNGVMDQRAVEQWIDRYELCWRTPQTDQLADLFSPGAIYIPSPWTKPLYGLEEIAEFWSPSATVPARSSPCPGTLWR